jgi:hypothetical protein
MKESYSSNIVKYGVVGSQLAMAFLLKRLRLYTLWCGFYPIQRYYRYPHLLSFDAIPVLACHVGLRPSFYRANELFVENDLNDADPGFKDAI